MHIWDISQLLDLDGRLKVANTREWLKECQSMKMKVDTRQGQQQGATTRDNNKEQQEAGTKRARTTTAGTTFGPVSRTLQDTTHAIAAAIAYPAFAIRRV
jgi:hypothetical protein